jgi:hypothetical protein
MELDVRGRFSGNLDQLPEYQNVAVSVDRLLSLQASLSYEDVQSSLGAVDGERGRRWSVSVEGDRVNGATFARLSATFDAGRPNGIAHSSFWLRSAAGLSPQPADEPFANFYFGAFGNNYVDRGTEKRYRDVGSFPGLALNELGGRNFVKALIEWALPPLRFERVGTPGAYLTWCRPAVFVGGLATNLDSADRRRTAVSAGAQADFRFTVVSTLDLTLSAGVAVAAANGQAPRPEAMLSLKILR